MSDALTDLDDQISALDAETGDADPDKVLEAILELHETRDELLAKIEEPPEAEEPPDDEADAPDFEPWKPIILVEFTAEYAVITANTKRVVQLGGDVRDGRAVLQADKPSKRKLTKETNGFVSVDGVKWER